MKILQSRSGEDAYDRPAHLTPPEPIIEWIMLFPNGRPASARLRTDDMAEVHAWASTYPANVTLHRRVVLEGHWFRHDEVVNIMPRPEATWM